MSLFKRLNLLAWLALGWAMWRRRAGRYDRFTLRLYWQAWRGSGSEAAWCALRMFRHDLGRGQLNRAGGPTVVPSSSPYLTQIVAMQAEWHHAFEGCVRQAASGAGVCLVGNAQSLRGAGQGAAIDTAALVVRFNHCFVPSEAQQDVGARTDVWVMAPGYVGPMPSLHAVRFVVVTGPEPQNRLKRWPQLQAFGQAGVPVLMVPLHAWRQCVARLGAPPSAGVLVLTWLLSLRAAHSAAGIAVYGIGAGVVPGRAYHLALPKHRPTSRHNWAGEAAWCHDLRVSGRVGGLPAPHVPVLAMANRTIQRLPGLSGLLGGRVLSWSRLGVFPAQATHTVGWGRKPSGLRAQKVARARGLGCYLLEDGFVRSYGTGDCFPPLSIVVDDVGIYYDSTRPSALELLLNSSADLLEGCAGEAAQAKSLILQHGLSKYNHAPRAGALPVPAGCLPSAPRVLLVDQTLGDVSVSLGGADEQTFRAMLSAALLRHPDAIIYVKTHPEVSAGQKKGYLSALKDEGRVVVLRDLAQPLSLISQVSHVYVVSSTMGFEALLAGKPVTCFGMPWYAGWGATHDEQTCSRRTHVRSVDELFAAAYLHYARYLNPSTFQRGSILDVIQWLLCQRDGGVRA